MRYSMILSIALVAAGFWHFNEYANELHYVISTGQTCGAVGKSADGLFYADVMASGGAESSTSMEFNTIDAAKRHVEQKCEAR